MDPVGTLRRDDLPDGGHSIWARIDPGYPDREISGTEWTCVWSTVPGWIGDRLEDETARDYAYAGAIPGTPAYTGEDVEVGQLVRITRPRSDKGHYALVQDVYHEKANGRYVFDVTGNGVKREPRAAQSHTWLWRWEFDVIEEER